jgi:hypothetical protein
MQFAIVGLTLLAVTANGQQPASTAKPHQESLRWLVEGAQDLGGEDRIDVTKALSPDERAALIDVISVQLRPGRKIADAPSEKNLLDAVKETRVKLIDLNGDGIPEVIAQASDNESCSPTGNCPIWVFMRSGRGYRLILERNAIQTFAIRPTRTNGFNDLVLGQHGSAFERDLFIYRFANGKYHKNACYDANWVSMDGDERHELKNPIVTPCNR